MENFRRYGMSELQQKQALSAYYASVTYMDEQVGRLLDALDRLDQRKNTVVIFTSDHGYNLGEHNCWQKLSLFEDSTRVPLIVSSPAHKKSAGQTCSAITELIDLYPTIAELSGLQSKAPGNLQGDSIVPQLSSPDEVPADGLAYTVTYQKGESIRLNRWRYNRWGGPDAKDPGEELYDHRNDPREFNNLAGNPDYEHTLNEMRQLLTQVRAHSKEQ